MTPQELKQHRIQLFRDCAAWRKPERVPFLANIVTWKINIDFEQCYFNLGNCALHDPSA